MKITSTNVAVKNVNMVVYGAPGAGKTYMIRTAPSPIIISAEGGMLSLSDVTPAIDVINVSSRQECIDVYAWLKNSKEADKYKTVCIDSLSEIAEVLLSEELKSHKDGRKAYGNMAQEMMIVVRKFRDLDKNSYMTTKLKTNIDEDSGLVSYQPYVPGRTFLEALPYYFDVVTPLLIGKDSDNRPVRYLLTQGNYQYIAKDRSGTLKPKEKPDISHIISTILKHKQKRNTNGITT